MSPYSKAANYRKCLHLIYTPHYPKGGLQSFITEPESNIDVTCGLFPWSDNTASSTTRHASNAEMLHMVWNIDASNLQITRLFSPYGDCLPLQTNALPEENTSVVCWLIHDVV